MEGWQVNKDELPALGEGLQRHRGRLLTFRVHFHERIVHHEKAVRSFYEVACHGQAQRQGRRVLYAAERNVQRDLGTIPVGQRQQHGPVQQDPGVAARGHQGERFPETVAHAVVERRLPGAEHLDPCPPRFSAAPPPNGPLRRGETLLPRPSPGRQALRPIGREPGRQAHACRLRAFRARRAGRPALSRLACKGQEERGSVGIGCRKGSAFFDARGKLPELVPFLSVEVHEPVRRCKGFLPDLVIIK